MYEVTKTYGSAEGWSCCFRQPMATSHCKDPHGYPLSFRLTFQSPCLNDLNWVIDFGSLKPVKEFLKESFDHRTVLAEDDPALEDFQQLYAKWGFQEPLVIPFVGCEGFAKYVFEQVDEMLEQMAMDGKLQGDTNNGVFLKSVEVREHDGNSAIYYGE